MFNSAYPKNNAHFTTILFVPSDTAHAHCGPVFLLIYK